MWCLEAGVECGGKSDTNKEGEYLLKLILGGHHEGSDEVPCSGGGEGTSGEDGANGRR